MTFHLEIEISLYFSLFLPPRQGFRPEILASRNTGELNRLGPPIIRIAPILVFDRVPAKRRVDIRPAVIVLVIKSPSALIPDLVRSTQFIRCGRNLNPCSDFLGNSSRKLLNKRVLFPRICMKMDQN